MLAVKAVEEVKCQRAESAIPLSLDVPVPYQVLGAAPCVVSCKPELKALILAEPPPVGSCHLNPLPSLVPSRAQISAPGKGRWSLVFAQGPFFILRTVDFGVQFAQMVM